MSCPRCNGENYYNCGAIYVCKCSHEWVLIAVIDADARYPVDASFFHERALKAFMPDRSEELC